MLVRLLAIFFFLFCNACNVFASEKCLPDYIVGQVIYKSPLCNKNISISRNSESFSPSSGQCLMYNDKVFVKNQCVARIVSDEGSTNLGREYALSTWKAPQKKIVHSSLHDDLGFVRAISKLFALQTINRPIVSQGINDECLDQNSNSTALTSLLNLPVGTQKIGEDVRVLTIAWKEDTGVGFVEVSINREDSAVPDFTSRVCWKSWTTLSLPNGLKRGDRLVLRAVDAQDNRLQWSIEVCSAGDLPNTPVAPKNDAMTGLWRLIKAPIEYRLDALSRMNSDTSGLVAPRGIFNAFLADIPVGENN